MYYPSGVSGQNNDNNFIYVAPFKNSIYKVLWQTKQRQYNAKTKVHDTESNNKSDIKKTTVEDNEKQ